MEDKAARGIILKSQIHSNMSQTSRNTLVKTTRTSNFFSAQTCYPIEATVTTKNQNSDLVGQFGLRKYSQPLLQRNS